MANGDNKWGVGYGAILWMTNFLSQTPKVVAVGRKDDIQFDITLSNGNELSVVLVEVYRLGRSDVVSILTEFPDANIIVTNGNWNRVTSDAKTYGDTIKIGVFNMNQFVAILNGDDIDRYGLPAFKTDRGRRR